jgi:hypothetical protein
LFPWVFSLFVDSEYFGFGENMVSGSGDWRLEEVGVSRLSFFKTSSGRLLGYALEIRADSLMVGRF